MVPSGVSLESVPRSCAQVRAAFRTSPRLSCRGVLARYVFVLVRGLHNATPLVPWIRIFGRQDFLRDTRRWAFFIGRRRVSDGAALRALTRVSLLDSRIPYSLTNILCLI